MTDWTPEQIAGMVRLKEAQDKKLAEGARTRIMKEALDLADRGDSEGYNAIKVMCSDVLAMLAQLQRTWVGLTDEEIVLIVAECAASHQHTDIHFARAIQAKLKEKNTWLI
jgi:hypothetical protein